MRLLKRFHSAYRLKNNIDYFVIFDDNLGFNFPILMTPMNMDRFMFVGIKVNF